MLHSIRWPIALTLVILTCNLLQAQIPKPKDAPAPLAPEESARTFKLPPGFKLELIASEPLIREPTGVCWDEQGRFFVCEMHGYNLEGQFDIEELNKTGELDKVVRRIQASEKHKQAAEAQTYGTIKLLRDTNADGRMDEATVWADRLQPCLGICPARGGLIATGQTEIVYLADRDNDGKAEIREVLYTGFGAGALERTINCPQWGPDNWIYVGRGTSGGTITGPHLAKPVDLPSTDFRIKPDGTAIEPITGATKTIGCAFDDAGDRFVVSTRDPAIAVAPIEWRYLKRNPFMATPSLESSLTNDPSVKPISQPHPWRQQRANDPGFAKYYTDRYGKAESAPNGYLTSGCSPLIYLDSVLPGLQGQLLTCEPAQNLIFRGVLKRDGLRTSLARSAEDSQHEFLSSSDSWFHAIALSHAPDGAIYVIDFYREIIEDYSAIPRYLQQQYGLVNGKDRGRIWRLTHEQAEKTLGGDRNMAGLSNKQLVAEAASPLLWRRTTARRLILERQLVRRHNEFVALLQEQLRKPQSSVAIQNLFHTLSGLQIGADDVLFALRHSDPMVRRQGLWNAEPFLGGEPALLELAIQLTEDADQRVRLQAALSLGELDGDRALDALAKLAAEQGDDPWFATAIISSASKSADRLIDKLIPSDSTTTLSLGASAILQNLAATIGAARNEDQLAALLTKCTSLVDAQHAIRNSILEGLAEGLKRSKKGLLTSKSGRAALTQLLLHPRDAVRARAIQIAGLVGFTDSPEMKAILQDALSAALDAKRDVPARVASLNLLGAAGDGQTIAQLLPLVHSREPLEIQLAAIAAAGSSSNLEFVEKLIERFPALSPIAQNAILDLIFSRKDRIANLVTALEDHRLASADLPSLRKSQLLEHSDAKLRDRAKAILGKAPSVNRQEIITRYQVALTGDHDLKKGKEAFEKHCAKCHQLGKTGASIGPDLDSVRSRPTESLLLDVLDPSGVINPKYRTYNVVTQDGRVLTGLLLDESATTITLAREKDQRDVILRIDIEEIRVSAKSLMPDDLEKTVPPEELANLLAFVRDQAPAIANSAILFDDEVEFLAQLKEGDAEAKLDYGSKRFGTASLHITTGQRHSPAIPSWSFSIVEKPAADNEFRYLRFAWNAAGAGAMFELAANKQWPAANKPVRRYFSGKNTTKWAATEVSPDAPRDWTIVTVDLYKDFGAFTLTGIAPTALGGDAWFDRIELLKSIE
jgi:putative membrane-bound dehydrogenase-like protein